MASPWKLLARLVSRRRGQDQENNASDREKPNVLAISGPADTPAEESSNFADRVIGEEPPRRDQSEEVSRGPQPSEESAIDVQDMAGLESPTIRDAVDPTSPNDADIVVTEESNTPKIDRTVQNLPRKQKGRGKKANVGSVGSQPSVFEPAVSDEMVSLDEEITVLRKQLATKLQQQNAQLKKMLARFER